MRVTILFLVLFTSRVLSADAQIPAKQGENKPQEQKHTVKEITKSDFLKSVFNYEANPKEWKFEGDLPALVEFYASWCGPCKTLAPILEELASEYGDKIRIYKVNTEKEYELAAVFGIRNIPCMLLIPMNEMPRMAMGALPKKQLKGLIDNFLLKNTN